MNERIFELAEQAHEETYRVMGSTCLQEAFDDLYTEKFAELIVRECIDKIESHRIPVGNSAAGEMACEWTYAALIEIRDEIKEHFGVEDENIKAGAEIHAGDGGYEIGTQEAFDEFAKKRNEK